MYEVFFDGIEDEVLVDGEKKLFFGVSKKKPVLDYYEDNRCYIKE